MHGDYIGLPLLAAKFSSRITLVNSLRKHLITATQGHKCSFIGRTGAFPVNGRHNSKEEQ